MALLLSPNDIRQLGFDWPTETISEQYVVMQGAKIDLEQTLAAMQSSRDFYQRQINQAYVFKSQTGADYSDFTDRFDEYVRTASRLRQGITHLKKIIDTYASED